MRPLRLVIEGFTCFKDEQPPLDFTSLELFAITGPTGAGKTSILDAIIFALYGKVPRVGKTYRELISLGRDRLSVRLEFEMGPRRFRVVRTGRRGRSGEAQLEEILGHRDKPIASGVHSVDDEITELLGLRYDAFTQAVVLPQGEFARFLKSPPGDRREILRDLLKLQIYERMRKTAYEQSKTISTELASVEKRLEQDYKDATPPVLEAKKAELESQEKKNQKLDSSRSTAEGELEELRRVYRKAMELKDERGRLGELEKIEPQMEKDAGRLALARKVEPIVPLLDAADEVKRHLETEKERSKKAGQVFEDLQTALDAAKGRLQKAREDSRELPALQERVRALDEVKGLLEPRNSARMRLEEARKALERLDEEEAAAKSDIPRVTQHVEELEKDLANARRDRETVPYNEELDRLLEDLRDQAAQLATLRQRALEEATDLEHLEKRRDDLAKTASSAQDTAQQAREKLKKEEERREKTEASLREAERQHSSDHLRHHLEVGKKCPVCEQKVKALPPPLQFALIDALASQYEESQESVRETRRVLEQNNRDVTTAQTKLEAVVKDLERTRDNLGSSTRDIEQCVGELRSRVDSSITQIEGERLESTILSVAKTQAQLRDQFAEMTKNVLKLEKSLGEARNTLDRLVSEKDLREKQRRELYERAEKAEEELGGYEERIAKVTAAPDPKAEADELSRRIKALEAALEKAKENERSTSNEYASAEKAYEEARRVAEGAADRSRAAAERAHREVLASGFENEAAARNAKLPLEEQSRIDQEVSGFRQQLHAVSRRVADLEGELNGCRLADEDLDSKENEVAKLRKDYEKGTKEAGALGQKIKVLAQKIEKADELEQELDELKERFAIYQRLSNDLRSEHFQAYLLEEAFRVLVEGASERLKKLSGRYTLDYWEDSFHVLDHDNAGEQRSADTLSGGETFLASLALALELSEQVQRAAGAVNLDSLFIDEGFGTLDSETLDTVAAAIEALPVGGRMVGIITHIRELTERLPACIRVEKSADGSRILPGR